MQVRICRQPAGAIDGIPLEQFRAGVIYEIGAQLAGIFLAQGWAEPVQDDSTVAPPRPPPNRIAALVLVVDDETDLRQLTANLLTCNGYDVVQARHGVEAILQLREHSPDLVVLDLNMPVMDGWQFRSEQQRLEDGHLATIPVLLLTGADDASDHAGTLKAAGLVRKPFNSEELLSAIEVALRR
jgi:CheY-like chemotaxis protein